MNENEIQILVEKVMAQINPSLSIVEHRKDKGPILQQKDGVFLTINEAVEAAKIAEKALMKISLATRERMIQSMRETSLEHAEELAEWAVKETGLGRVEDKKAKNMLAAMKTPGTEDLDHKAFSGDDGVAMIEYAPMGIFGSITPTTNPVATMINNSISLVSAGNVVVYNPHPSAKRVTLKTMQLLNKAIRSAGGPENVLTSVLDPTIDTSTELMNHKDVKALVVTGGAAVVKAAMSVGKKVIAAGPGNPPVVVDETANIKQAAKDIVFGSSFDNNILCTAEKQIFVVDEVARSLKEEMVKHKAIELKHFQLEKLLKVILVEQNGKMIVNKDFIGKDASVLLKAAGIKADKETKLIFSETNSDHPLVSIEMLMPIIPVVKVSCVNEAIRLAVQSEKGNRHTAIMHSQNITHLNRMEKAIQTTIFVKNGSSLAGLGYQGEGFTTLTIAGPTGEGMTSAKTFTRKCRSVQVERV